MLNTKRSVSAAFLTELYFRSFGSPSFRDLLISGIQTDASVSRLVENLMTPGQTSSCLQCLVKHLKCVFVAHIYCAVLCRIM